MAKELPYFKFHINEWFNGDITLEDYELQGIFVNVCAYYWSKDCDLSKPNLLKKFRGIEDKIELLIQADIIKVVGENIRIHFLNEQYGSKEVQKIANRQNGLLGGRPKKEKTEEKPNGLIFDNRNETETKANDNPNITNIDYSIVEKNIEDKSVHTKLDKKRFVPPSLVEWRSYFLENGYREDVADRSWKGYDVADWHNTAGKKINNWKQTAINVWFKDDNKSQQVSPQRKMVY